MHIIELMLHRFSQGVARGTYKVPQPLLAKFSESTAAHLKRQFEREPKDFTLRMSNLGKPLCQLQCEQAGIKGISWDNNSLTRNTFGDICEDVLMFMLHAAGVPIVSEQEPVELMIAGQRIKGTLDLVIDLSKLNDYGCAADPRVWDIKSASDWTFKNKFTLPFDRFIEEDTFGNISQLFLYAAAKGIKVGGLIIQNKSTGEIKIFEVPEDQAQWKEHFVKEAEAKVNLLVSLRETIPSKKILDINEIFRKKNTGNKVLSTTCSFCEFKFHCWPDVQLKPQLVGTSKIPKMVYYTKINDL